MATTPPTLCGLYTRVSSRNQAERDYSSLESQREKLEAYCKSQDGYVAYRVYEDGGYSADTLNRPALKALLQDIRDGRITCVLAYKIDRLTRSVKDFHVLMDLLDRHGVKFVSITQSLDTHHPMGRLLRNILLDFAQFEREMTADRTRDKMHQRATKGMWNGGNIPYGYVNDGKRLVKHPDEAPRVTFMFQQFAEDPSLARLRRELHHRGWTMRTGQPWSKMSVDYILKNSRYCGKIVFNGETFQGQHEPLIGEGLFLKVQSLQRTHTKVTSRYERPFLLKGLLKCSDCQSVMTPHYTQKRHKDGSVYRIAYYRCTKTMHHSNAVCPIRSLNADAVERTIIQDLYDLGQNVDFVTLTTDDINRDQKAKVRPLEQEATRLSARMDTLEREIGRYVQAVGQGTITVKRLDQEVQQREREKETIQVQYDEIQQQIREGMARDFNAEIVLDNLKNFEKVFQALTGQEQTEVIRCLVQDIEVFPHKFALNIFELARPSTGSKMRQGWLPGQDSNLRPFG